MNKRRVFRCRRSVAPTLALTLTIMAATGCCWVASQAHVDDAATAEAVPILVTLAAEEGEALVAAQRRVLERLRSAMSADAFAAVRTYETLPIVALTATPETIALLLTVTDVRSVEADRSFVSLGASDP